MKNTQKGFLGITLIILLALAMAGGGAYVYTHQEVAEDTEPTTSISTDASTTTTIITSPKNQIQATIKTNGSDLLTVESNGGMCDYGICRTETTIKNDGTFKSTNRSEGTKTGNLGTSAVSELYAAIESADFRAIKSMPFNGMCPTANDGLEFTYTFHTSIGTEIIKSCTTNIDQSSDLFKVVQEVIAAANSSY